MSHNVLTREERGALEACLQQARLLLTKREFAEAQRTLHQALVLDPTDAGVLSLCGVAWEMQGYNEEAARYYRAALAFEPAYTQATENLVRVTRWAYRPDGIKQNLKAPQPGHKPGCQGSSQESP